MKRASENRAWLSRWEHFHLVVGASDGLPIISRRYRPIWLAGDRGHRSQNRTCVRHGEGKRFVAVFTCAVSVAGSRQVRYCRSVANDAFTAIYLCTFMRRHGPCVVCLTRLTLATLSAAPNQRLTRGPNKVNPQRTGRHPQEPYLLIRLGTSLRAHRNGLAQRLAAGRPPERTLLEASPRRRMPPRPLTRRWTR